MILMDVSMLMNQVCERSKGSTLDPTEISQKQLPQVGPRGKISQLFRLLDLNQFPCNSCLPESSSASTTQQLVSVQQSAG
jgi:hypothetical protein